MQAYVMIGLIIALIGLIIALTPTLHVSPATITSLQPPLRHLVTLKCVALLIVISLVDSYVFVVELCWGC
jgi:hypothetical protein